MVDTIKNVVNTLLYVKQSNDSKWDAHILEKLTLILLIQISPKSWKQMIFHLKCNIRELFSPGFLDLQLLFFTFVFPSYNYGNT